MRSGLRVGHCCATASSAFSCTSRTHGGAGLHTLWAQRSPAVQVCALHILMMISAVRDSLCLLTGKLDLSVTYVQVQPIVAQVLDALRPMLHGRRGGRIDVQLEARPPHARCVVPT